MKTILLIEDCPDYREIITDYLVQADYEVVAAPCPDEAFQMLDGLEIDLIICDLLMPFALGTKGLDFDHSFDVGVRTMEELAFVFPGTPIVAISSAPAVAMKDFVRGLEVARLGKPFKRDELLHLVRTLLGVRAARGPDAVTSMMFDA